MTPTSEAPGRAPRLAALAALLCLTLLPGLARADQRVDARRHFRNGMAAVAAGHYDEGITELKTAYAIKPHPSVLFNIAKAYQDAGKIAEALDYYQQYLSYDPPDAEGVNARVRELQASVAPKEQPKPAEPAPGPGPAAKPDEATAKKLERLDELLGRLDAAVARAEALQKPNTATPASAQPRPEEPRPAPAAAPAQTAEAREELAAEKGDAYEEVVVTASRYAQSALTAPVSTTTITAEEIQLSGATSLPELLRRVPGIDVMRLGVSSADVSVRGFNQRVSNKLLVLVDGRSVYEDFLGFTLFEELPIELEEIERIEIVRGPASALYGANAFVGLVNIITRRPGSGPSSLARAGGGSGALGEARYVASQRAGRFAFRASAGYSQADKYSVDFAPDRADYRPQQADPNLALRSARANGVVSVGIARGVEAQASAGVNKIYTEIYPLGLLRNYVLDGVHVYNQADLLAGPFKVRAFWNHLEADAGPQYWPVGQPSLASHVVNNVLDGDAQLDQPFQLGGEHHLNVGVGYRLKSTRWEYLGTAPVEHHFSAYVQEEYRPLPLVSLSGSVRADRHPLLDNGSPGFALSPRGAVVVTPLEGHAVHFSAGSAFREPTLVESYTHLEVPVPGQPNVAALTEGNTHLKPERIFALELGYRAELSAVSLDVALYRNQVRDLIVLSPLQPVPASSATGATYLAGRSVFQNDSPVYTALGGEVGVKSSPVDRLGLRGAFAAERIDADGASAEQCGPCAEVPAFKVYAGASYRTPFHVDLNADASWVSSTKWIEREPDATGGIAFVGNPLGAYAVVNARVAYRFFDDHVEAALVGTNLAQAHQEHPFGNRVDTRVMGMIGAQL